MLLWGHCCSLHLVPWLHAELLEIQVFLWLQLLLHVGQLLDQMLKGDPPLGRLLPAPAHQLIHLSSTNHVR